MKNYSRNSFVRPMVLRNKSQVFHHRCEERGGSKNEEREYIEEYKNMQEEKVYRCCCGGIIELQEPNGDTFKLTAEEEYIIPPGCLIEKCNKCGDHWIGPGDCDRIVEAIKKYYGL